MGAGRAGPHLEEALLSAYLAHQVDPARRAAFSAHLAECDQCRARLSRVESLMDLLTTPARPEPDDLAWRRLRDRVKAQLEAEARQRPTTQDLQVGRWWATAGLAAVVAVALGVWLIPRGSRSTAIFDPPPLALPEATSAPEFPVLASGASHLDATLATGLRLRLSPHSRVESMGIREGEEMLRLRSGEIEVRSAIDRTDRPRVRVRTPRFEVAGPSRAFRVGYWANRYAVVVEDGHLIATGVPFGSEQIISAGSVRRGRLASGSSDPLEAPVSPAMAPDALVELHDGSPPSPRRGRFDGTPRASVNVDDVGAPPEPAPRPTVASEPLVRVDPVPTEVEVVKPPVDPARDALRRARSAYYQARDLDEAQRWANRAVRLGANRAEAQRGYRLLCDVHVAARRPQKAVEACRMALNGAPREAQRALHYTLATVFRTQLQDCRSAIEHYNRVLVFGAKSVLDDDARLFRAACSLSLGDRDRAERDIRALEARSGWLARPDELERLKRQLRDGTQTKMPSADPFKNAKSRSPKRLGNEN